MDLNNARGMVAIRKDNFASQGLRGDKSAYFNNADYWLYNASGVRKYKPAQVTYTDADGATVTEDSAMTKLGITNMLQAGELPMLSGKILPAKYWKVVDGLPVRKTPDERDAADAAEVQAAADAQAKADAHAAKRPKRSQINAATSAVKAATSVAELRNAVGLLAQLMDSILTYQRVDVDEDEV